MAGPYIVNAIRDEIIRHLDKDGEMEEGKLILAVGKEKLAADIASAIEGQIVELTWDVINDFVREVLKR